MTEQTAFTESDERQTLRKEVAKNLTNSDLRSVEDALA